ncbi:hypothetical protein ES708_20721 [subsurface metagenome]
MNNAAILRYYRKQLGEILNLKLKQSGKIHLPVDLLITGNRYKYIYSRMEVQNS